MSSAAALVLLLGVGCEMSIAEFPLDVSLDITSFKVGGEVMCRVGPLADDERVEFTWSSGATGERYTIRSSDTPDKPLVCTAKTYIGDAQKREGSAALEVENEAPVLHVALTASEPTRGEKVKCRATVTDTHDGEVHLQYRWSTGETTPELTIGPRHRPGDGLRCTVTATDPHGLSVTDDASTTVGNLPPSVMVSVSKDTAFIGETVRCEAVGTDEVAGDLRYAFRWSNGHRAQTLQIPSSAHPGDQYECTATARDPQGQTATGTALVRVGNRVPTVANVRVEPEAVRVGATVYCRADVDDDTGPPTVRYTWNGVEGGESYRVTPGTAAGPLVCVVSATDASGAEATGMATAMVRNSAPSVSARITGRARPLRGDTVECVGNGVDANRDEIQYTYAWSNGATTAAITIGPSDVPGELLICTVTGTDTAGASTTATARKHVGNAQPTIDSLHVSNTSPRVGDTVACVATASDLEGEAHIEDITWPPSAERGASFTVPEGTAAGQVMSCRVTAADAHGGEVHRSVPFTVQNTPPTIHAALSAREAVVGDVLACAVTAADDNGAHAVTTRVEWPDGSTDDTYVVRPEDKPGTSVTCVATAEDTAGAEVTVAASAVVRNTAPTVSVALSPRGPEPGDTLTCHASAADANEEALHTTYAWQDGSTAPTWTVPGGMPYGTPIECMVTVTDPSGGSVVGRADTLVQHAPELVSIAVSHDEVVFGDTVTCAASFTDVEDAEVDVEYTWSSGQTGPSIVIGVADVAEDPLVCTATATDSAGATASGEAFVNVLNTLPLAQAVVTPYAAHVGDTVTCTADVFDPDEPGLEATVAWSDGYASPERVLTAADLAQHALHCTASAEDNRGETTGTTTAYVLDARVAMAADGATVCALRQDRSVWCWSEETDCTKRREGAVPGLETAYALGGVVRHGGGGITAMAADGWAYEWAAAEDAPSPALLARGGEQSGGGGAYRFVVKDGRVHHWTVGYTNAFTGVVPAIEHNRPVVLDDVVDVRSADASSWGACAVTGDGSVWCWGLFKPGFYDSVHARQMTGVQNALDVKVGNREACALASDGTVTCWSRANDFEPQARALPPMASLNSGLSTLCGVSEAGVGYCWSSGSAVEVADGLGTAAVATLRNNGLCAMDVDGAVRCARDGSDVAPGAPYATCRLEPTAVTPASTWVDVAAGATHTCAARSDGRIACWGASDTADNVAVGVPLDERTAAIVTDNGADLMYGDKLSSGEGYTCQVASGTVQCWGENDAAGAYSGIPGRVSTIEGLTGVVDVSAGGSHACALRGNGEVWCWGSNRSQQISSDSSLLTTPPVLTFEGASAVSAGYAHTCVVKAAGVWCRGENASYQAGPVSGNSLGAFVTYTESAVDVVAGTSHSCALLADGAVRCWGRSDAIGPGPSSYGNVLAFGVDDVESFDARAHTCAVRSDHTLWCWGRAPYGQLGTRVTRARTPFIVPGISGVVKVSAGASHTCALFEDGAIRCWGKTAHLGAGEFDTTIPGTIPVDLSAR